VIAKEVALDKKVEPEMVSYQYDEEAKKKREKNRGIKFLSKGPERVLKYQKTLFWKHAVFELQFFVKSCPIPLNQDRQPILKFYIEQDKVHVSNIKILKAYIFYK
jgi:hypothetical protein